MSAGPAPASTPVITLACGAYDSTAGLRDGRVPIAGFALEYVTLSADEIFRRVSLSEDFDVAELSLSMYVHLLSQGDTRFVAVPVFPLRSFRHRHIYVAADSPVTDPEQLAGARIGLSRYHMTSVVWQRGALEEQFGVKNSEITWVRAGAAVPGLPTGRITLHLPEWARIEDVQDRSLPELLVTGEIAAALLVAAPDGLGTSVRRLFPDPRATETAYFASSGIFPIMHILVIRRGIHESFPRLAPVLLEGFETSKRMAIASYRTGTSPSLLPFSEIEFERDMPMFHGDPNPYGIGENVHVLAAFLRYSYEQGLIETVLEPEALFDPNARSRADRDHSAVAASASPGRLLWD